MAYSGDIEQGLMRHGGDIYRNKVVMDYSVNLNFRPVPEEIMAAAREGLMHTDQYPDPLQQKLRTAIAKMTGTDMSQVVCGCGASELIMAIVHALKPRNALIASPCYAGYEYALSAENTTITEFKLEESQNFELGGHFTELIDDHTDIVMVANPNNPSGKLIEPGVLSQIKMRCAQTKTRLVLDESFLPLTDRYRSKAKADDGVIYLRTFTKVFAIPGIRTGYLLCSDAEITGRIRKHLPEWNLSAIAERAGIAAVKVLTKTEYLKQSVADIANERLYLASELKKLGFKVYPSDTNFLLVRTDPGLYEALLEKGILIRNCVDFHGLDNRYVRLAVRKHEDNERLLDQLRSMRCGT